MENGSCFQEFEFRPRPLPSGDMPLGLRAAGHFRCDRGRIILPEANTCILLVWCVSGQIRATLGDKDHLLKPVQAIIAMIDIPCSMAAMRNSTEFYWCCIDGSEADEIATKLGLETGIFDYSSSPMDMIIDWIEKLPSQSDRIERELSTAAYEMLYSIAKDVKHRNIDPVFTDIKSYIAKNINNYSLTIDSIAEHFSIHRSTLSTMFKKNTHLSAKDYITEKRLKKAEQLLTSTEDKISDISSMCGFGDPNYFSRMFRKARGMTPRDYREALSIK
ncbi:MAG: helix-turn-helix transcriptional regulator [Sedimentisphaeraceae bacterium JB056]